MEQKYNQTQNIRCEIANKRLFLYLGHCVVAGDLCCMMSFGFLLAFYNPGNCTHFLVIRASEHPEDENSSFLASGLIDMLACDFFPSSAIGPFGGLQFLHNVSKTSTLFLLLFCTRQQGGGRAGPPPPPPPVIIIRLLRSYNVSTYRVSLKIIIPVDLFC